MDAPLPFELLLAVNKMDTLPRVASHKRVEACVRKRYKQAGLPALAAVHLVSSTRRIGIPRLLNEVVERVRTARCCANATPIQTARVANGACLSAVGCLSPVRPRCPATLRNKCL